MTSKPRIRPRDLSMEELDEFSVATPGVPKKTVQAVLDAADYKRLKWFAESSGMSVSHAIRKAVMPLVLGMPSDGPEGWRFRDAA